MAKSKSQERREAVQKASEGTTPGWKENQQKETTAKDQDQRDAEQETAGTVKIKMLTDYRDVAKKGDVAEFDAEKANELVRLGRAEFVKTAKVAKSTEESETDSKDDFETGKDSDE